MVVSNVKAIKVCKENCNAKGVKLVKIYKSQ